ncbi:hypothetical protein [Eisenbergiella sp.]
MEPVSVPMFKEALIVTPGIRSILWTVTTLETDKHLQAIALELKVADTDVKLQTNLLIHITACWDFHSRSPSGMFFGTPETFLR